MTTYANLCERAARSLFRIAEAVAEYPGEGIEELRHLVMCNDAGTPVPIDRSTPMRLLQNPHPLAGKNMLGGLVGDWTTEGWAHGTRTTQWESNTNGVLEWWTRQVKPLALGMTTRENVDALAPDWYLVDYAEHLDHSMPEAVRERIASVLETAGSDDDSWPKGAAGCRTTGKVRLHSRSIIPCDKMANTRDLVWPPIALAALVREVGLRIDPAILRRFGVTPDGKRSATVESGHSA